MPGATAAWGAAVRSGRDTGEGVMTGMDLRLELTDVELTMEPMIAFFRICVSQNGNPRNVMKSYGAITEFFDRLQPHTKFVSLPRNVDEISLAHDPSYRTAVQAQLDGILSISDILRSEMFLEFFQLTDDYAGTQPRQLPQTSANPLIAPPSAGHLQVPDVSVPSTWPSVSFQPRAEPGGAAAAPAPVALMWELPANPRRAAGAGAPPATSPAMPAMPATTGNLGGGGGVQLMGWDAVAAAPPQSAQLCWEMPVQRQDYFLMKSQSTLPSAAVPTQPQVPNSWPPASNYELSANRDRVGGNLPPTAMAPQVPDRRPDGGVVLTAQARQSMPPSTAPGLRVPSPMPDDPFASIPHATANARLRVASPLRGNSVATLSASPVVRAPGAGPISLQRNTSPSTMPLMARAISPSGAALTPPMAVAAGTTLQQPLVPSPMPPTRMGGATPPNADSPGTLVTAPSSGHSTPMSHAGSLKGAPHASQRRGSAHNSMMSSGYRSGSGSGGGGSRPWCVICMAKPEEVAVDPCGHLSMCEQCGSLVKSCPVCRGPINKLLRVFVVR